MGFEKIDRIWGFTQVPGTDWTVLAGTDSEVALAVAQKAIVSSALIGALILSGVLGCVVFISRRISRPILAIQGISRRISQGQVQERAALMGPIELVDVATQFNAMLDAMAAFQLDLRNSQERLKLALDGAKLVNWEYTAATDETQMSETWSVLLGGEAKPLTYQDGSFAHGIPVEDLLILRQSMVKALKGATPELIVEYRYNRFDGKQIWVACHGRVVERDAEGRALRVVGILREITEMKAAEEALTQSEAFTRAVADNTPAMIGYWSAELRCDFSNHAFLEWFGKTAQQMQGIRMQDLLGDTLFHLNEPYIQGALRGEQQHFEQILTRANGEVGYTLAHYIPDVNAEGVSGFFVLIFDATELKQTEAALNVAKEAAESANRAKSQFLATMSHEIRTPLNIMKGMAYAMRRTGLAPKQEECLAHIDAAGAHLLTMVSDVLDLAKIEAGKLELEHVEINVAQIAAEIVDMLRGNALLKNISLVIEMQAVTSPLLGDATRLRQALLNYLSNALKFTEAGTITLRVWAQQESDSDALLRFEVQDTGIGIDAQTAARLFTPFEQADNSDTRRHGGTGLGLVITKRFAQLMGGSAGVESVPGVGSTFWLTALLQKPTRKPLVAEMPLLADAEVSPEQILQRDFSGTRILLVEDDATTRMIFLDLLEESGLIVDTATDGAFAVDKVAKQAYALIVMDMQMPKMSGLEATRLIRATTGAMQIPIIMLTGNVFEETKTMCFEAGANDFVNKPVEPEDLFSLILKWLTVARDTQQPGV